MSYQVSCLLHDRAGDASLQRQWVASSFHDITPHCPLASGNITVEFPSGIWGDTSQGTAFSGTLENRFQGSTRGKISSKFPGYSAPGTSLSMACRAFPQCHFIFAPSADNHHIKMLFRVFHESNLAFPSLIIFHPSLFQLKN